jgi:hypothetical protein
MAWTVFTTTFLWTPTMRGFLRPDVSMWSIMGLSGSGREGSFWMFPTLAVLALACFYLDGRGRARTLVHAFLVVWHALLAWIVFQGTIRTGGTGYFEGAMWGVRVPLWILTVPFAAACCLTVVVVVLEQRGRRVVPRRRWTAINRRDLVLAVLLLPVAAAFFWSGEGIDWPTRLGTAATIVQWILLTQALATSGNERP